MLKETDVSRKTLIKKIKIKIKIKISKTCIHFDSGKNHPEEDLRRGKIRFKYKYNLHV